MTRIPTSNGCRCDCHSDRAHLVDWLEGAAQAATNDVNWLKDHKRPYEGRAQAASTLRAYADQLRTDQPAACQPTGAVNGYTADD